MPSDERSTNNHTRRSVLAAGAGTVGLGKVGWHTLIRDPPGPEGVPKSIKQSADVTDRLQNLFGDQFEGFEIGRPDLLIDARYVGDTFVQASVKQFLIEHFRAHGIHLQWLDHPTRHNKRKFEREYGYNTQRILWDPRGYYHQEIEPDLKNIALQLIVVEGHELRPGFGMLYSPWAARLGPGEGYVNGMNFGNRAVVATRITEWEMARLIFHELAHLALCHDFSDENLGVMGTNERLTLLDREWHSLRENLDNVRDATGVDLLGRRCLWFDDPGGLGTHDVGCVQSTVDDAGNRIIGSTDGLRSSVRSATPDQ